MNVYSVANWLASLPLLIIEDSAANIQAALNTLETGSNITKIIVSDGPGAEISVSVSQIISDANVLALLVNLDGSTARITVSDTATNIAAGFATLGTDSQINVIKISNNAVLTLTASQIGANLAAVGELVDANGSAAQVLVRDTSVNIVANLAKLQLAGSTITSIVVSNNTQLTLTAQQIHDDANALAKVRFNNGTTTNLFKVVDTGANISTYLDALAANVNIASITDSNSAAIALSVAQITSDAAALAKLVNANTAPYTLTVSDTASNLSSALDALNGDTHVTAIVVDDSGSLTVSVAQIGADAHALSLVSNLGGGAYSLIVEDVAANIATAIASLNVNSHVLKIEVQSGTVSLSSVAALTTYATALAKLYLADGSTPASVYVSDIAANISNALDALHGNSQVAGLIVTDSGSSEVVVSFAQLTADADVLAKLFDADGVTLANVTVVDTSLNLSFTALGSLNADAQVNNIIVTSGYVEVSVAQWTNDTAALAKLVYVGGGQAEVAIYDSAANITAALASLNADGQIGAIIVVSGEVSVSAETAATDPTALAKLYNLDGSLNVSVLDSAANISQYLDTLNTKARVNSIVINDGQPLTLQAYQVAGDLTALSEIQGDYAIDVTDSGANVQQYLDQLEANGYITSITLDDVSTPTLTLAYGQLVADADALQKIVSSFDVAVTGVSASQAAGVAALVARESSGLVTSIAVSDTAANVAASLDSLEAAAVLAATLTIALSDPLDAMSISETQYNADAAALADITTAYSLNVTNVVAADAVAVAGYAHVVSIAVSDTAANVQAALDALEGVAGTIASIALTDVLTPTLTLDYGQLASDADVLGKISNAYNVAVTGVAAADASGVAAIVAGLDGVHAHLSSIAVSDTAANVATYLDSLESVATGLATLTIALSNPATAMSISETQYNADTAALAAITTAYHLDITAVLAADAASIAADAHVAALAVVDSASHVQAALDALEGVAGKIGSITLTDGATPTLTLAYDQLSADASVLAKISSDYQVAVSNVTAAEASGVAAIIAALDGGHATLSSIAVRDTAANVATNLDSLEAVAAGLPNFTIALSDPSTTMSISQAKFFADSIAMSDITTDYTLDVTGVLAAHVTTIVFDGHVVSMEIVDSAANVQSALDTLEGVSSKIGSITFTDSGAPTLTLAYGQLVADADALQKIVSSFDVAVTGVSASQAAGVAALVARESSGLVTSIAVSDTAANVAASLDSLEAAAVLAATLTIALSDPLDAMSISETQYNADAAALADITTAYSLNVTNVVAADAVAVAGYAHVVSIAVSDTAANVQAALDALEGVAGTIASIALTDVLTPTLTLDYGQLASDADVLGKISNAYNVAVTGVAAADASGVAAIVAGLDGVHAHLSSIAVSDTAANVATYLDSLESVATGLATLTIALSNPATAMSISETQYNADTAALAAITTAYHLDITAVLAADAASIAADAHVAALAVVDSASHVQAALDALEGVAGKIGSITLTDGATPTLTLAYDQLSADASVLAKISSDYQVAVSNVTAAEASGVAAIIAALDGGHASLSSIAVSDTAADVAANLDSLEAVAIGLPNFTITLSDPSDAMSISEMQYTYTAALADITSYTLDVTGVLAADAAAISANGHVTAIQVLDLGSAIISNLDALDDNTKITSIVISDNAGLALSAFEAANDGFAISLLQNADLSSIELIVSDTAANLSLYLDQLNTESNISSIVVTDNAALSLGAAQVADTVAIGKLVNADGSGATINVSDTAANISVYLSALEANQNLASITISDNRAITVSIANLQADQDAIAQLQNQNGDPVTLIVEDTAANIGANAATLAQNAEITSVVVSNNAALILSVARYEADTALFAILSNADSSPYAIDISDNATNISAALDALNGNIHIARISIVGNGVVGVDVAQITLDATALSKLYNGSDLGGSTYELSAVDSAAAIAAAFDALNGDSHVEAITVASGGEVILSAASAVGDVAAEAKLYLANGVTLATVAVSDTAAAISNDFNQLNANTHVDSVSISDDQTLTLQVSQVLNDTAVLGKIQGSYTISVQDSAAQVTAYLSQLLDISQITSIALTDVSAPTISVNEATFIANAAVLDKIGSAFTLAITGVMVAQLAAVEAAIAGLPVNAAASIALVDTASAVQIGLAALEAHVAQIGSVTLTDALPPTISVSEATFLADATVLNKIGSAFTLSITGVTVAELAALETAIAGLPVNATATIAIVDNASAIQTGLAALEAHVAQIGSVTLTDALPPTISVNEATFLADAAVLAKIGGAFMLAITGVTVAQFAAVQTAIVGLSINAAATIVISDSAIDVQNGLAALEAHVAQIGSVALTDALPPTITVNEATIVADVAVLAKIGSAFTLAITGVTVAQLAAVETVIASLSVNATATIAIVDIAAAIQTGLAALEAHVAQITSVTLTDALAPTIVVSEATFVADAAVLDKIGSAFTLAITGVTMAQLAAVETAIAGLPINATATIAVFDTASAVQTGLDGLEAHAAQIGSVTLTDALPPTITVNETTFVADAAALTKIGSAFHLVIAGVTVAQLAAVETAIAGLPINATLTIAIVDTASAIQTSLAVLEAHVAQIGSVKLTDASTPAITLSEATFVAGAAVLDKIGSAFTLAVTGVTVAQLAVADAAIAGLPVNAAATIAISDSAINVQNGLAALEANLAQIGSITLTDALPPTISVNEATFFADSAVLAKIGSAFALAITGVTVAQCAAVEAGIAGLPLNTVATVGIVDSALDVQNGLAALEAHAAQIGSVTLTDVLSPTISVSEANVVADAAILAKIGGAFTLAITGVNVAQLAAVENAIAGVSVNATASIAIVDSALDVQNGLAALEAHVSQIGSIALTDALPPTIILNEATFVADAGVLDKIGSAFTLAITGVTVAQFAVVETAIAGLPVNTLSTIAVVDSALNVQNGLTTLEAHVAQIGSVALTDISPPTITLNEAIFIADGAVLAKIGSAFTLAVTGVTLAQLAAVETAIAGLPVNAAATVAISDSSLNVQNGLAALEANVARIRSVTLSDVSTPTITVSETTFIADAAVLDKIGSAFHLAITGVTVAQLAAVATAIAGLSVNATPMIAIVDTASAIQNGLDALEALVTRIGTIALTDALPPTISVNETTFVADAAVLAKIGGAFTLAITGVSVAQLAAVETAIAGLPVNATVTIAISDSALDVQNGLAALEAHVAQIGGITLTDALAPTVTLSEATFVADAAVLDKIGSAFHLAITSVTVAQLAAVETILAGLSLNATSTVAIGDNAINVQNGLAALEAHISQIGSVTLTDALPQTINVSEATFITDAAVLDKIGSAFHLAITGVTVAQLAAVETAIAGLSVNASATVAVSDSAINIQNGLATLEAHVAQIGSVTLTDALPPTITLSEAIFVPNAAVLDKIGGAFTLAIFGVTVAQLAVVEAAIAGLSVNTMARVAVSDSAINVQNGLAALEAHLAQIGSVTLTDASTPTITLSEAALVADAAVLAKIGSAFQVAVTGATVAQLTAVETAIAELPVNATATIAIVDTASAIQNGLATLEAHVAQIGGVTLTDALPPTINVSEATFVADAALLAKISSAFHLAVTGVTVAQLAAVETAIAGLPVNATATIAINDTASAVQNGLAGLEARVSQVGSITLTDALPPTINVNEATLVADAAVLDKIGSAFHLAITGVTVAQLTVVETAIGGLPVNATATIAIVDSAIDVQNGLAALEAHVSQIGGVTLTDGSTPTITVNETTFVADAAVIAKIGSAFHLAITGVAVAQLATVENAIAGLPVNATATIAISDTAIDIQNGLAALEAHVAQISSVTLTDASTPTITLNETTLVADAAVLAKIGSAFHLAITGVSLAQMAAVESAVAGLPLNVAATIAISDSAIDVQNGLATLEAHVTQIGSVTLTDASTPTISVNEATFIADAAVLDKIASAFRLAISGVTVAQLAAVETAIAVLPVNATATIAIVDTASAIQAGLAALEAHVAQIGTVILTDGSTPTITLNEATFVADAAVLAKIGSAFRLAITGVAVAQLATVVTAIAVLPVNATPTIVIVDTASAIQTGLAALEAHVAQIGSITLTDALAPTITLNEATFVADSAVLAKIGGTFALAVTGVTVAQLAVVETAIAGLSVNATATIAIVDTASAVQTGLGALEAHVAQIGSVTLTDALPPTINVNEAAFVADAAVLAKVGSAFTLAITGVTFAQLAAVETAIAGLPVNAAVTIAISDSAIDVQNGLAALETHVAQIGSVTLTDASTPTISVSEATFAADAAVLAKIASAFHLAITGVAVAQLATVETAIAGLPVNATPTIAIVDSASAIQNGLAALEAHVVQIGSVTLTNALPPTITLSEATFVADSAVLAKIGSAFTLAITSVTVAQLAVVETAIAGLPGSATPTIAIVDSASAIQTGLAALQVHVAQIGSVTLTDALPQTISVTEATLVADAAVLAKIGSPFAIAITGVSVAQLSAVETAIAGLPVNATATIGIVDTASAVQNGLAALQAHVAQIGNVTLTDGSTPTITLNETAFVADAALLDKVGSVFHLAITGVTVAQLSAVEIAIAGLPVNATATIGIVDTASAVRSGLAELEAHVAQISSVTLTDASAPTITLNEPTFVADAAVIAKIGSAFHLAITGVTVAQLSAVETAISGLPVNATATITISDSAIDVQNGLTALEAEAAQITGVSLTDPSTPTFTLGRSQLSADAAIFGDISSNYNVAVRGVLASQVAAVVSAVAGLDGNRAHLASIAVYDSVVNVGANLSALNAQAAVTTIAIVGGAGTLQGGTSIAAATLSVSGAGTSVTVAENLNYQGSFSEGVGASMTISAGDTLTLGGPNTLSGVIGGQGTLALSGATTFIGGAQPDTFGSALINTSNIGVTSGLLDLSGAVSGTGGATIAAGATLEVDAKVGAGQTLAFGPAGGELILDDLNIGGAQLFHGSIAGFAAGDTLDVGAPFGAGTVLAFTENAGHTAGALSVTNGAAHASIALTGDFLAADFHTQLSGASTLITYHT